MFGKLRRGRVAPSQKPLGIAVPKATFDPSVLREIHSPAAGYPELKALITGALENPPMRTNAILGKELNRLAATTNSTRDAGTDKPNSLREDPLWSTPNSWKR